MPQKRNLRQKIIVVLLQKRYLFALTRKKLVVNRLPLKARIYKGLGNVSETFFGEEPQTSVTGGISAKKCRRKSESCGDVAGLAGFEPTG